MIRGRILKFEELYSNYGKYGMLYIQDEFNNKKYKVSISGSLINHGRIKADDLGFRCIVELKNKVNTMGYEYAKSVSVMRYSTTQVWFNQ